MIGYRVYVEGGNRADEKGSYDGYSSKYDEWIPLFSPRIQPIFSKTSRSIYDDFVDIDDDFDAQFPCEPNHSRVFAVPRLRKCTSRLFTHLMNEFGNQGGFDLILSRAQQIVDSCQTQEDMTLLCGLVEMVAKPTPIYHKEFVLEFFPKVSEVAKRIIRNAPDKFLRDASKEKTDALVRSIDNINKRLLTKDEREK